MLNSEWISPENLFVSYVKSCNCYLCFCETPVMSIMYCRNFILHLCIIWFCAAILKQFFSSWLVCVLNHENLQFGRAFNPICPSSFLGICCFIEQSCYVLNQEEWQCLTCGDSLNESCQQIQSHICGSLVSLLAME